MIGKSTKVVYFFVMTVFLPSIVQANYVPLTPGGVPRIELNQMSLTNISLTDLLNDILAISVAVAAVLAVIMLTIGGFKYMTSDSAFNMGSAKENITGAIVGLLIVLLAVTLLSAIHPDIVKLDLFS